MDAEKFARMFPALLNHYPVVRQRDHYREPTRKAAGAAGAALGTGAAAEQLGSEVAAKGDFWAALDVMLAQSLSENDAARVRRAFSKVYQEHLESMNLEDIEEVAKAL